MPITPIPESRPEAVARAGLAPTPAAPDPLPLIDPLSATLAADADADPAAVRTALLLFRAACDLARGRRTPAQLTRWTTEQARAGLTAWALRQDPGTSWTVASLRAQRLDGEVVEASARLVAGPGRSVAMALRLEREHPHSAWRCTVADPGPLARPRADGRQPLRRG